MGCNPFDFFHLDRFLMYCRADPEVKEWVQVLAQRYAKMKIVVGRDKLDEVQVRSIPWLLVVPRP